MHFGETIEVRSNLKLTMRERGKIVARREGHNIWLNQGRNYLARLISYDTGEVPFEDNRVKYMGLGIGGTRQNSLAVANSPPVSPTGSGGFYPAGTNLQVDTDPTVEMLERPVQVTAAPLFLKQVTMPPIFQPRSDLAPSNPLNTQSEFHCLFEVTDVNFGSLLSVPVSEVMLYTAAADPSLGINHGIAYDTFDSLSKTAAFDLEIVWTIRF